MLGSSNLTDGGLRSNREAVIVLDRPEDADAVEEVRLLFAGLWDAGHVLTDEKLEAFAKVRRSSPRPSPDPDREIEKTVGKAEPPNVNVASRKQSREHVFLETLRRRVQQYRPAFNEVMAILNEHGFPSRGSRRCRRRQRDEPLPELCSQGSRGWRRSLANRADPGFGRAA